MAITTRMTPEEHKEIFQAMSESIVAEPDVPPDPSPDDAPFPKPKKQDINPHALRGALHLDEHHPGWANKIDLRTFDISDVNNCVVGQVAGEYDDHAHKLFPGVGDGYTAEAKRFGIMPNSNTEALNRSWRILVAERQDRS